MNCLRCAAVLCLVLVPGLTFAQDKFFDSNGVSIRYVEQGQGQPVVLVHGNGGRLETWTTTGVMQNLARDYRTIAFDARGHGKSGKPHDPKQYGREMELDIVRLLDHLGIGRAHIVGYSMGANTTAQLLTLHPERFLTATLVAGAGRVEWTPEDARRMEQEASEIEKECVSRSQIYRLAPLDAPKPTEQYIEAQSAACMTNVDQDRFALAALRRAFGDELTTTAQASAVQVPTLGVVGTQDAMLVRLEALKKLRPDLTLVVVDGATHAGERGIIRRAEFIVALRKFLGANQMQSR